MPTNYSGIVVGRRYIQSKDKYVYYVETERHMVDAGVSFDVVFSKKGYDLGDDIKYRIHKTERGYICCA